MDESTGRPLRITDQVIQQLDEIIQRARREHSRWGFFAALYRNVTLAVKDGMVTGRFADGPRMERFDVVFASRHLDAVECFRQGQPISNCWLAAFQSAAGRRLLILQHLLMGMNAHIKVDPRVKTAVRPE